MPNGGKIVMVNSGPTNNE